jgi:hypothetical protein
MIELEPFVATQSWVNKEYSKGLRTHPCGSLVLRISKVEVFPTFTTWGKPVRKSRTKLHKGMVQTQSLKLNDELWSNGTMVLNSEL